MIHKCTTVKAGQACSLMTASGCGFGAAEENCQPVVEKCETGDGCTHAQEWPGGKYCNKFAAPASKWAFGICNMATHVKIERKVEDRKINPLKASKRGGH